MSRADVAARAITDQLDPADLPVDPEKVARELGAIVVQQGNDTGVSGMLLRRDGQIILGLNSDRPPVARRLTLAHLIGHLQLHRRRDLLLDTIDRHRYSKLSSMPLDREEAEANRFAAALLAPENLVRKAVAEAEFGTAAELVEILADRFEMSRAAMGYRLMTLGVVMDL
ncbi:ImmA/IrrE family metallo-endopeptidase [Streptomyces mirabilis]|uniref:ImmA/IrrE family metallo-endopeptidase n=1 Tax=Streptomyces mirabilis TaxID=68239 RepID=UPI0036B74BB3